MRLNPIVIALTLGCGVATAEPLSDADREALIEKLDSLKTQATERLDARFRAGVAAYQSAIGSDDEALSLYLKCVEKVDFIDQKKKESDFRDWKRKEDERLSKASFKLALRHQLNWLSLTLQAASENADRDKLAVAAQGAMDNVLRDIEKLKDQQALLKQGVTGTVFAKAYEISTLKLEKWPLSPIDVSQIYDQVILPQYRNPKSIDKLRENWLRRIQQEGLMVEHWAGAAKTPRGGKEDRRIGMIDNSRPPELDRFISDTVPTMQWQMELDLFKSGDQAGAALRMLGHIEKNLGHPSSKDWTDQFRAMLVAPPAPPTVGKEP
jgi:hypothetical protein